MNCFTSVHAQKSLTRLSGAIKRLGFFDCVDVLKVMQENLIAARVCKDYSAKFFDGNSFTKYGKDFFAFSLQAFEYIEVGENEPISRNSSRAVLSFVPADFFVHDRSGLSFPIFVDTTVRLYRFGGTLDNIAVIFVYNEENFIMKMDTLLIKLDRAIKKVPHIDNPWLVNIYLMKALEIRGLARKELDKVREVVDSDVVITHYAEQFEKLSNLVYGLDSNFR